MSIIGLSPFMVLGVEIARREGEILDRRQIPAPDQVAKGRTLVCFRIA